MLPGQSSSVLHWGLPVGFPLLVVVVVVVVLVLVEVVLVLLGGIPQIVSCGSLTHWLVLRLQQVTPGQSTINDATKEEGQY
jgi:hypothetical protein